MKPKIKLILFGAFAPICFAVGLATHGTISFGFLLTGLLCGALALYFTLLNYRLYNVTKFQARCWAFLFFAVFAVGVLAYWRQSNPEPQQPDYVKETEVTYSQLNAFYPFGYAVFYFDGSGRLINEVSDSHFIKWNIDWNKVTIEPDIPNGKVRWTFPPLSWTDSSHKLPDMKMEGLDHWCEIHDFKKGFFQLNLPSVPDQPVVFPGILSDDQRNPVFVVGMRIRTQDAENEIHTIFGNSFEFCQKGTYPEEPAEYVKGTYAPRYWVESLFPFGYAVIYFNQEGEKKVEFHDNGLHWEMDPNLFKIEPNIRAGTVKCTIPTMSAESSNQDINVPGLTVVMPFYNGIGDWIENVATTNLAAYTIILSTNQQNPVFAIGFRVPPASLQRAVLPIVPRQAIK